MNCEFSQLSFITIQTHVKLVFREFMTLATNFRQNDENEKYENSIELLLYSYEAEVI